MIKSLFAIIIIPIKNTFSSLRLILTKFFALILTLVSVIMTFLAYILNIVPSTKLNKKLMTFMLYVITLFENI